MSGPGGIAWPRRALHGVLNGGRAGCQILRTGDHPRVRTGTPQRIAHALTGCQRSGFLIRNPVPEKVAHTTFEPTGIGVFEKGLQQR